MKVGKDSRYQQRVKIAGFILVTTLAVLMMILYIFVPESRLYIFMGVINVYFLKHILRL